MSKPHPYITLGIGVLIIGFAAILIRKAEAPGTITAFYRLAIGTTALIIPFYRRKHHSPLPIKGIWLAVAGGFFFALDMALWSTGVVISGAAVPTIMVNTAPLWVGLGAILFFREKRNLFFWIGLCLSIAGSVVVMQGDLGNSVDLEKGAILGGIAAIFYAAFYLVTQKGRDKLSTLTYFWISSFSATVTLLIINLIRGESFTGYGLAAYINFIILGIVVQVFGWFLLNYSQGYLPASIIAPSLLGQPIFTALLAWLLLGEILTVRQIIGAIIVLSGIFIVHRNSR